MPSTVIRQYDYDAAAAALTVEFVTGRIYRYADVPSATALALGAASSKGRYFNRCIRDRYAFVEVS